jgi:hypothetical protein
MSVAKKKLFQETASPGKTRGVFPGASDPQTKLRIDKVAAEQLREKIQSRILENPKAQKKAALLISLWIAGKASARTKK